MRTRGLKNPSTAPLAPLIASVSLGSSYPAAAHDLKDPLYRDETIADVEITVDVRRLPSGNREYLYDITSPIQGRSIKRVCIREVAAINHVDTIKNKLTVVIR